MFRSLDLSVEKNKERLIDSFVKSIILNDDSIIITTVFKNEPATIMTKKEVESISKIGSDINGLTPSCTLSNYFYVKSRAAFSGCPVIVLSVI